MFYRIKITDDNYEPECIGAFLVEHGYYKNGSKEIFTTDNIKSAELYKKRMSEKFKDTTYTIVEFTEEKL